MISKKKDVVLTSPDKDSGFVIPYEDKESKEKEERKANDAQTTEELQSRLLERCRSAEYVSIRGLCTQTGCNPEDLDKLLMKELVDNALDACQAGPKASVMFRPYDGFLTLTVEDNGKGITKNDLERMIDFDRFYSSKFYKRPTRGALGNAMKFIIGLPHALERECNTPLPRPQISIQSLDYKHLITIEADEQTGNPSARFDSTLYGVPKGSRISVNLLRYQENWGYKTEYADLMSAYAIFNPNATLKLTTADPYLKCDFPAIRKDYSKFEGSSSIHWYSFNSFKELVEAIKTSMRTGERNLTLTQFIKQFRGLTSDEKVAKLIEELRDESINNVSELTDHNGLMKKLYNLMKENSINPRNDVLGKIGKANFLKRIEQIYGTVKEFKYRIDGDVSPEEDYSSPFVLEIALAVLEKDTGLKVVIGINHSPTLENPFEGYVVKWEDNRGESHETAIVRPTLEKYGIDKNQNIVLIIHLICPNIEYESYGKGKINISCFSGSLCRNLTRVCKFYPRYRIRGHREGRESQASRLLRKELLRRKDILDNMRQIPLSERTTQQGIYYKVRNQMEGEIDVKRSSFIKTLGNLCKEIGSDLSFREKLGITAAERAQLYFRGEITPISWDRIEDLATKGSDVILIEKEGVCEVLEPYAAKRGIALLNSRGFATDYAKQLLNLSQKLKGNIFLLTDFDVSGYLIALNVLEGQIPRIGVSLNMIEKLGITRRDLEEKYDTEDGKAPMKHLKALPEQIQEEVKHKRIEIDAVLAAVGPEKLWSYIEQSILEMAPTRNMNRSVDLTIQLPSEIAESINAMTGFIGSAGLEKQKELRRMLDDWKEGFVDVGDKEEELQSQIVEEIRKSESVQELAKQLKSISERIPKNN